MPTAPHPHLLLTNIALNFGLKNVLDHVDLTINPSDRLGVVGDNGRGKTSLLRIIAGTLEPSAGTITLHGSIGVAEQTIESALTFGQLSHRAIQDSVSALEQLDQAAQTLAQGTADSAEQYDVALSLATALDAWDAERRLTRVLTQLNALYDPETPLSELSIGQRHRVWLACLLGGDQDFILLDEPTNHLDQAALEFLTESLTSRQGGVVLVSHDRALLSDVTTKILDLDPTPDGILRIYGGYRDYIRGRASLTASWAQAFAQQQAQREELEEHLTAAQDRLVSGWRPPKGTGKHQRTTRAGAHVKAVHRRTAALEEFAVDVPEPPLKLHFPDLNGKESAGLPSLIRADGVMFAGRMAQHIDVQLAAGSKFLITGPNGAGKSTLLALLAGLLVPTEGEVHVRQETDDHSGARIGYLSQESILPAEMNVLDFFEQHRPLFPLEELGLLPPAEFSKNVGELSVGQQRRLHLASVLAQRPNVLLLDEPTNHLSVPLVEQLTAALQETGAAVVLVSHDRQLLRDLQDWPRKMLQTSVG